MNILEHAWDALDRRVRARNPPPANREELWVALQEEWKNLGKDFLEALYGSIVRWIEALIAVKGWHTKY